MDLRHLAVILDTGRDHANRLAGPADAPLVAALSAMTEMSVHYAAQPDGGTLFPIDDMFAQLAERYQ
jgi:hypothetical protein